MTNGGNVTRVWLGLGAQKIGLAWTVRAISRGAKVYTQERKNSDQGQLLNES